MALQLPSAWNRAVFPSEGRVPHHAAHDDAFQRKELSFFPIYGPYNELVSSLMGNSVGPVEIVFLLEDTGVIT